MDPYNSSSSISSSSYSSGSVYSAPSISSSSSSSFFSSSSSSSSSSASAGVYSAPADEPSSPDHNQPEEPHVQQQQQQPVQVYQIGNHHQTSCCTLKMKKTMMIAMPILLALALGTATAALALTVAILPITIAVGVVSLIIVIAAVIFAIKKVKEFNWRDRYAQNFIQDIQIQEMNRPRHENQLPPSTPNKVEDVVINSDMDKKHKVDIKVKVPNADKVPDANSELSPQDKEELQREEALAALGEVYKQQQAVVQENLADLEKEMVSYLLAIENFHDNLNISTETEKNVEALPTRIDQLFEKVKKFIEALKIFSAINIRFKQTLAPLEPFQIDRFQSGMKNINAMIVKQSKIAKQIEESVPKSGKVFDYYSKSYVDLSPSPIEIAIARMPLAIAQVEGSMERMNMFLSPFLLGHSQIRSSILPE